MDVVLRPAGPTNPWRARLKNGLVEVRANDAPTSLGRLLMILFAAAEPESVELINQLPFSSRTYLLEEGNFHRWDNDALCQTIGLQVLRTTVRRYRHPLNLTLTLEHPKHEQRTISATELLSSPAAP